MEFQFEVSAHIIPPDVAQLIPQLRVSVLPLVWFSQGVSRYTDLAAQVRRVCGMADGWQCVGGVSYAKCAPVVARRPSAATDRRVWAGCQGAGDIGDRTHMTRF